MRNYVVYNQQDIKAFFELRNLVSVGFSAKSSIGQEDDFLVGLETYNSHMDFSK